MFKCTIQIIVLQEINIAQITIFHEYYCLTNQIKSNVGENQSTWGKKKLSGQSREPTNSIHMSQRVRKLNAGHIGERQLSALTTRPTMPLVLLLLSFLLIIVQGLLFENTYRVE